MGTLATCALVFRKVESVTTNRRRTFQERFGDCYHRQRDQSHSAAPSHSPCLTLRGLLPYPRPSASPIAADTNSRLQFCDAS